jgi:hypothetical protein
MSSIIRLRRGTSAQWATSTVVLATAELGLDTTLNKLKVGNGLYTWPNLPFINVLPSELAELSQDAINSALTMGLHMSKTYDDVANTITIDSTLTNVDNTSDANKPVSTATATALGLKAPLASPVLTGTPLAPTAVSTVNTTQIATTEFVQTAVANLVNSAPAALNTLKELSDALGSDANYATTISTALGLKAPLASPTFTGTVILPSGTVDSAAIAWRAYDTEADLPAAGTVHGMFAHVHGTGSAYFAHAGLWVKLASTESPTFTGTVSGITKTMVGLGNVNNTSDLDKPVSSAASLLLGQLQTSLTDGLAAKVDKATVPTLKSDTAYTINNQTDRYNRIEFDASTAITVTIPTNLSDPWPVGSSCEIMQAGTGKITVVGQSGVTLNAPDSQFKTRVQWSTLILEKRGANEWLVSGDSEL